VATVIDGDAHSLAEYRWPKRAAILLGSEGHGLDCKLVDLCDDRLTIPMHRGTDSLNVAVATGIVLYHARHQD
jgi:TrmH family RNA methyltransferase